MPDEAHIHVFANVWPCGHGKIRFPVGEPGSLEIRECPKCARRWRVVVVPGSTRFGDTLRLVWSEMERRGVRG